MRKIQIPKTHFIGEKGDKENANTAWMVCHGYGQLVEYFSKKFEIPELDDHYLIFPEASNHFYLEGFSGKIGATWMTRYNREEAISDQQIYLSEVARVFDFTQFKTRVVFGFSQGVHTVIRWILDSKVRCEYLILWGAGLPEDYFKKMLDQKLVGKIFFVLGSKDEFIPKEKAETYLSEYKKNGLQFELIWYDGPHDVIPEPLKKVVAAIEKKN
ncbi:alpha/beta hydrolase [Luteibaculum oceani]|nr:hypothetical protein [Luteibaculum oceani]